MPTLLKQPSNINTNTCTSTSTSTSTSTGASTNTNCYNSPPKPLNGQSNAARNNPSATNFITGQTGVVYLIKSCTNAYRATVGLVCTIKKMPAWVLVSVQLVYLARADNRATKSAGLSAYEVDLPIHEVAEDIQ
ncbi:hypothetical protein BDV93DRAFT_510199 [Ceratobasidium sp. AG-I]|nr:hypothetical protein BDV93DRAFT_510199 [Ceratobasidium sp. AG-I]